MAPVVMSPEATAMLITSETLDRCRAALLARREIDADLISAAQKALRDYEEDPLYDNHQRYMAARSALMTSQTDIDLSVEAFEYAVEAHVEARRAFEISKVQITPPVMAEAPMPVPVAANVKPTIT